MTVGLVGILADLGLASASQRSFFDYTGAQTAERRSVLTTALVTMMTGAFVLAIVVFAFRAPIAERCSERRRKRQSSPGWSFC